MKKYGFHHHMHVSSIAKKVFDRCLHIKEVSAGDHKFRVRGYEDIAVRILNARGLNLEHLVDGHSGSCPSFRYRSPCGKERFYYPDFLIRQPKSKDVILEIKSCYTAGFGKKSMWDIIRRKAKAVELEGYRFVLWVIHDGKVILSTNAYRMSYSKMSRILTDRIR